MASTATSSSSKAPCSARCDALVEALGEQIPEAEFVVPGGGYFLWLDLAEGTDTTALLAEAKGEGVAFVAGPDFMIDGGEQQPSPLLCQRAAGADPRGRRAYRPGAGARPRRLARLAAVAPSADPTSVAAA